MPGLVGVAGFHRRGDMHQAGTVATDNKHPGDDVLLADMVLGNVFANSRCAQAVSELQAKVRSLGGDPENRGSVSGSLHRGWVNIKSTITGMDEAAVLAECELGEDVAKTAYEDALKKDLPADVRSMIER